MQPYFVPYIGYFQLIAAVDMFILYDNVKYTKKGWINRNRILRDKKEVTISLPLKGNSDYLDICKRELATQFNPDQLLNQLAEAYRRAPYFSQTFPLVEKIVRYEDVNLFRFLHHSIVRICEHFGIATDIAVSSTIPIADDLKKQDKVLALCAALGATRYVNAIGGMALYSREMFKERGIALKFIKSKPFEYAQFSGQFASNLSIIDVMMFTPIDTIKTCISTNYDLI
jgi:hypothetical protein